ncbi:MAG: hypothetical protein R6T99_03180 [Bacteroidales bacterium]
MWDLGILDSLKGHRHGCTVRAIAGKTGISGFGVLVLLETGMRMELVMEKPFYEVLDFFPALLSLAAMIRLLK